MTIKALEQAAIDAHRRHERFTDFWAQHGENARQAAGHDRQRFAKLYHRLLCLCIAGNLDGQQPIGDDNPEPQWFKDDETHKPADVGTQAVFQGFGQ